MSVLQTTHHDEVKKHPLGLSIVLHLLPGLLIGAFYFVLVNPLANLGLPSITAFLLTSVLVLIPFELGFLLLQAKRAGTRKLEGIVLYRERIPFTQYLLWVPIIFILAGLVFTLLRPLSTTLEAWFSWIPQSLKLDMGLNGGYSKQILIYTTLLNFLFVVLIGPAIEELYFRGYLLPRMPDLKGWAPVLHSSLFALYHTWTPWMFVTRTLAVLPLIYVVRWKKNIWLGVAAHCLLNAIDVILVIAVILNMP
ncbi:MAG: CPBP family intramembrane metalloprotease [Anaerolineales bacterium]|nr:CPBP family intramembrane metalloprotease [Anaerolineales bacterium]